MTEPILLDVDGVLFDFVGALCKHLGEFGVDLAPEQVTTWDIDRLCKGWTWQKKAIVKRVMASGEVNGLAWHAEIKPYKGAVDFVQRLGLEKVLYVTSPLGVHLWHEARVWALKKYFDAKPEQIIFAHSGAKKWMRGSMLVEDRYDTALSWAVENPGKFAYVLAQPWNTSGSSDPQQYRYSHDRVRLVRDYGEIRL